MEVSARIATADDVHDVADLLASARAAVDGERGGEQWLATDAPAAPAASELGPAAERRWYVGCIDEVPIGVTACGPRQWRDGRVVVAIEVMFVVPGAREVGVGEALVDAVIDGARERGAAAVEALALPGQRELKNLFERVGLVARAIVAHKSLGPA